MLNLLNLPDDSLIRCENKIEKGDAVLRFEKHPERLDVFLCADQSLPLCCVLRWNEPIESDVRILGDTWERAYADLSWQGLSARRFLPWYFLLTDGKVTIGCGVKTGPASFVSFCCDGEGVTAVFDVRNGDAGVALAGREVLIGSLVCHEYKDVSPFEAGKRFCRLLCDKPLAPPEPVYGGNNWYYAYGNSSFSELLCDARYQAKLAGDNKNRPFMVVDDGWEQGSCSGPWEPNEKFGDMAKLAREIKSLGVKPGLWVRYLTDESNTLPDEWRLNNESRCYDPSRPDVLNYIAETTQKFCGWGYELIKHDFSTVDLFGDWGKDLNGAITKKKNWFFADRSRTSAEIVLDFYRTIKKAAGSALILGCNTVSHLTAGEAELFRIGDDTSGKEWERTRLFGINALAFRLIQHKAFYDVDADCVGVMDHHIPWSLNKRWLDLLSESGTPLFVSCPEGALTEEQEKDMIKAYRLAAVQSGNLEPLDWLWNELPRLWRVGEKTVQYDWIENVYPSAINE